MSPAESISDRARDDLGVPPGQSVGRRRILFISHEATRTGAPIVLLSLIRTLRERFGVECATLMLRGGPLEADFRALGPAWIFPRPRPLGRFLRRLPGLGRWLLSRERRLLRDEIRLLSPALIYANTVAVREALDFLEFLPAPVLTHVHELEMVMRLIGDENVDRALERSDRLIAVSESVRSYLIRGRGVDPARIELVHEFIPTEITLEGPEDHRRRLVREEFGIPDDALVVGGVGTLDWRKGSDFFVPLARAVGGRLRDRPVHFVWIGGGTQDYLRGTLDCRTFEAERAGLGGLVHFVGQRADPLRIVDALDVFVLTSREDPYPLVVLEAAALGKPIVCFADSGGIPEFVGDDCGFAVPYLDLEAMADRIAELLQDDRLKHRMGAASRAKVSSQHSPTVAVPKILDIVNEVLSDPGR